MRQSSAPMTRKPSRFHGVRTFLSGGAACSMALVGLCAQAQEEATSPPPRPATLVVDPDSAAALAIKNSIDLKIDAASVKEAEARLHQVDTLDNPRVDLSLSVVQQGPAPKLPPEFSKFFVSVIHTEAVSVTQPIWLGGAFEAQHSLAVRGIRVARSQADITRLAIAKLARDQVLKLGLDERLVGVNYETLAGLMEHERVTDKRYREGLVAFFEVAQAQAQVAAQERVIAEKQQDVEKDRALLRRTLGVDQATPVAISVGRFPERPTGTLQELISYAVDHRPEMLTAQRAVELAEAGIRVARASLRPSVVVQAQVQDQTATLVSQPVTYQVVLAFQQPLFDGHLAKAAVREQRARVEQARLMLESTARDVAEQVAEQYLLLDLYQKRIATAEVEERAALEQLRIARLRYVEDLGLGEEVITAQAAVARAQTSRANAESDLQTAILRLRAAMGMADLQEAEPQ
jgi:outer membrane protein